MPWPGLSWKGLNAGIGNFGNTLELRGWFLAAPRPLVSQREAANTILREDEGAGFRDVLGTAGLDGAGGRGGGIVVVPPRAPPGLGGRDGVRGAGLAGRAARAASPAPGRSAPLRGLSPALQTGKEDEKTEFMSSSPSSELPSK